MMSAWAWNKTLHSGVICHLGDEGGSLGSSCLEKVKVYKLGGGERSSDQAVGSTPPEQSAKWEGEEAAILKESCRREARTVASSQHEQARSPQLPAGSRPTGVRGAPSAHSPERLCLM